MKEAVKILRGESEKLGMNGKIGAIGFSRGGPFAAILAGQGDVQAALVHGNRYDYLHLGDRDPMLARFVKAWGPREGNEEKWAMHGAVAYLRKDAAPMFLNTSDKESEEYRLGLSQLDQKLTQMGIEHVYRVDLDGRGHQVSMDPDRLGEIYGFFRRQLDR